MSGIKGVNDKQRRVADLYAAAGFINGTEIYMSVFDCKLNSATQSFSRLMKENTAFQDYVDGLRTEFRKNMKVDSKMLIEEMTKIAMFEGASVVNRTKALAHLGRWLGMDQMIVKHEGELPKIEIVKPEEKKEPWQQ